MTQKEDRIWLFVGIVWSLAIWALYAAGIRFLLRHPMVFASLGLIFLIGILVFSIKLSKRDTRERKAQYAPLYKIGDMSIGMANTSIPMIKSFLEQLASAAIGVFTFLIGLAGYRISD
jgi:hypothetical protein